MVVGCASTVRTSASSIENTTTKQASPSSRRSRAAASSTGSAQRETRAARVRPSYSGCCGADAISTCSGPTVPRPLGLSRAERAVLHHGMERRAPRCVGILVGGDVEAASARRLDEAKRVAHAAPVGAAARLVMGDLDGDPALLADPDGLGDGVEEPGGLVPHVGGVQSAELPHLPGQGHDLLGGGVASGLVDEPGGEADGARLDALPDGAAHPAHLVGRRPALVEPHGARAQRAVAHEHRHVETGTGLVHAREVAGESGPRRRRAPGTQAPEARPRRLIRHHAGAAVADDVGGHALHDLERHLGIEEHREVVVAVHVDEARRHRQAGRLDLHPAPARHRAHGGDAIAPHRHVRDRARRAAAVVHGAASDDDVETVHRRCRHDVRGSGGQRHAP